MTEMTEWKVYTGSIDQIDEMSGADNGFLLRSSDGMYSGYHIFADEDFSSIDAFNVTHYLICKPRRYAAMIRQWALTGQPVWKKFNEESKIDDKEALELFLKINELYPEGIETSCPDWNNNLMNFSLNPFVMGATK